MEDGAGLAAWRLQCALLTTLVRERVLSLKKALQLAEMLVGEFELEQKWTAKELVVKLRDQLADLAPDM